MFNSIFTQASVIHFVMYFFLGIAMVWLFTRLYIWLTPYEDLKLIEEGNVAVAIALVGASLGFSLTLVSASMHSARLEEFVAWGGVSAAIQGIVYVVQAHLRALAVNDIYVRNNIAQAILSAGISLIVGVMCAGALVP